jgi:hypothetical protein
MKRKRLGQLQLSCEFPSKADLDWMEKAVQRHTDGIDAWWKQNRDELSCRQWMMIFISVWEAGRKVKLPNVPLQTASGTRTSLQAVVGTVKL